MNEIKLTIHLDSGKNLELSFGTVEQAVLGFRAISKTIPNSGGFYQIEEHGPMFFL